MEDSGDEGGNFLIADFRSGDISAEAIITVAVDQELVRDEALSDSLYVDRVDNFLQFWTRFDL